MHPFLPLQLLISPISCRCTLFFLPNESLSNSLFSLWFQRSSISCACPSGKLLTLFLCFELSSIQYCQYKWSLSYRAYYCALYKSVKEKSINSRNFYSYFKNSTLVLFHLVLSIHWKQTQKNYPKNALTG